MFLCRIGLHKYQEIKSKLTYVYYECSKCGKRKIFNIDLYNYIGLHLPQVRYNAKWLRKEVD